MTARDRPLWPLAALAAMLIGAFALILVAGAGLSFSGDDYLYYTRGAADGHGLPALSLHYLLLPHNGHMQVAGRLAYEAMFAAFGTDYGAFRVVEALTVVLCAGLLFALVRPRCGDWAALIAAGALAALGAAWEVMVWPFDLHTAGSLAAGLGAVLALERRTRTADGVACALLVLSAAFIELGLAFVAAAAVLVLADR